MNLFIYASGKRDLRNRLESNYIPEVGRRCPLHTLSVARVKYAGNWDPEPYAWTRFAPAVSARDGLRRSSRSRLPMRDLERAQTPLAHLTGTAAYNPSAGRRSKAMRHYVESGGVLLVDLCGGTGAFDESIRTAPFCHRFP